MAVHVEVTAGHRGIADERLVERAAGSVGSACGERPVSMRQPNHVKIIVGEQRRVVAVDASGLADEQLQASLRVVADGIAVARHVAIERRVAAHQLAQIRFDRFAVIDQDAIDDLFVGRAQAVPIRLVGVGRAGCGKALVVRPARD